MLQGLKTAVRGALYKSQPCGPSRPTMICYEWLLSQCFKCSEKQQEGSRLSPRLRDDWRAAAKADLGHALLACVSFI